MRIPSPQAPRPATRRRTATLCWAVALLGAAPATGRSADPPASSAAPVFIDVRTPEEYAAGHIDGALLLPYQTIGKTIAAAVPDKTTPLVLYCTVGGRSGIALKTLKKLGYRNASNGGGYDDLKKRFSSQRKDP
ncbi:MAG: rhodanese-like domain-containing protein [Elusimicrobia bacterium]|nr:rhodanese-like domain-containing protein [Elusimicrobiota bacterium]